MSSLVSVLVVMMHSQGQPRTDQGPAYLIQALAFFHGAVGLLRMPLFFFISGFLFLHTGATHGIPSYGCFVYRKAVRLLLPYAALSTAAFPIKAWLASRALRPISFTFSDYVNSLLDPAMNPVFFYWFIVALFVIFLAAPMLRRALLLDFWPLTLGLTVALLIVRWNTDQWIPWSRFGINAAANNLFYFWVGMLAWRWRHRWMPAPHPLLALAGGVTVLCYYVFAREVHHIRFLAVCMGIYSVYCIADFCIRRDWRLLRPLEGKTYQVYLLAWFPQQFVIVVLYKMFNVDYWACSLLMFASGLGIPLLTCWLVQRFCPSAGLLIGMKRPTTRQVELQVSPQPAAMAA